MNVFSDGTIGGIKNFKIQEFVPRAVWRKFGEKSIWYVDPELIKLAQFIRNHFDAPMFINNWHNGGSLQYRGFRPSYSRVGSTYSQHKLGKAMDFNIEDLSPQDIYDEVMKNSGLFLTSGVSAIEHPDHTPTWTHIDIRHTNSLHILVVRP